MVNKGNYKINLHKILFNFRVGTTQFKDHGFSSLVFVISDTAIPVEK